MDRSSFPPQKPQQSPPPSFSVILLILGICLFLLSTGIPYVYYDSNNKLPPYFWAYVAMLIIGVVLIGVNAKKVHEENNKNKKKKT